MKVQELINELKKHDPEKEVMIQQGEELEYATVSNVKDKTVMDENFENETEAVVLNY